MTPNIAKILGEELHRLANATREDWLRHEARIHREYFEPFDRLLEKKAQYYLKQADGGKENEWLLQEIEVLEKFREYVAILETISQNHLDNQYKLATQAQYWKEKWEGVEFWERVCLQIFSHYERLREQC